jgi:hypothetical protein
MGRFKAKPKIGAVVFAILTLSISPAFAQTLNASEEK